MLGLDSSLLSVSTGYHTRASLLPPEPHDEISLVGEQTCSAGCRIRARARYPETNRGIFTRCTHTQHLRDCICICSHSHSHSPKDQASQINRDYKNNAAFEILDEKVVVLYYWQAQECSPCLQKAQRGGKDQKNLSEIFHFQIFQVAS